MKYCLFLLVSLPALSQFVDIPDANFKACLVESYDTNSDGEISFTEAEAVMGTLTCFERDINSVVGIEAFINIRTLDLQCNNIVELPSLSGLKSLVELLLYNNQLEILNGLPDSLGILSLHTNRLESIGEELPPFLYFVDCTNNRIKYLSSMKHLVNIHTLYVPVNQISSIENFPDSLITLALASNNLKILPLLPPSIRDLFLKDNFLLELPELPPSLKVLVAPNNRLERLPELPKGMTRLDVGGNFLDHLPALPSTLTRLFIDRNQFRSIDATALPSEATLNNNWLDVASCAALSGRPAFNYRQGNPIFGNWGSENHQLEDFILFYGNGYVYELDCGL